MEVKVINTSSNDLPEYSKIGDSGMDLRAELSSVNHSMMHNAEYDEKRNKLIIFSGGRCIVPTGLYTSFPIGYEIQIRPRSGLAIKNGIIVLNTPGTIDSNYRGELGVILMNLSDEPFEIAQGDRIAQAVLNKVSKIEWSEVETLDETNRGKTGYGDSGIK